MHPPRATRLPGSLAALGGLRAARWVRESTRGQFDTYGPEAQREQQDAAIARWGLFDSGIEWQVAHSGRTVGSTTQFHEMIARAGIGYDVLLVGYVSRFARNLRTAVNARHDLHEAGAAIVFCDERVLSSDEDEWEEWAREAVEAEAYSRRLGKRIREGYAAKFRRLGDPGGRAPLGFKRAEEPPRTLGVDDATIPIGLRLFTRYAEGLVSIDELAREFGMNDRTVNDILKNPIYNGWVTRKGERAAAPWRPAPPVDDALWERVQALLSSRTRGGGPRRIDRPDSLRGLIRCVCGSSIRASGFMVGRHRRVHSIQPCPEGISQKLWASDTWLAPIEAQLAGLRVDGGMAAEVIAVLSRQDQPVVPIDSARFDRMRRKLAFEMADRKIDEQEFLATMRRLKEEEAGVDDMGLTGPAVTATEAIEYIRQFAATWAKRL
jgi:DNA invertase Pin-like site-specific DNA recombinase